MKKNYFLKPFLLLSIAIFWASQPTFAQVTEVVSGLSSPYGLAVDEAGNLYIAESGVTGNKISYLFLPDQVAQTFDLFTSLNQPTRLKIYNNYLYVVETGGNRISRFNLLVAPPQLVPYITTGLTSPIGIAIKNNVVLVGDYGSYAIRKVLTNTPPFQSSTLINDLSTDIIIDGDYFYYANPDYGRVNYNSLVSPNPVDESLFALLTAPASLLIHENYLYTADKATGNIDRFNLIGGSTFPQRVVSELNNPQSMVVYNNQLYIAEMGANRIVKLDLSSLSATSFEGNNQPNLWVDSRSNTLHIYAEKSIEQAHIFDSVGKRITTTLSDGAIDISSLSAGVYFILLTDEINQTYSLKFIK